ncbi:MAG: BON domain-containing protein [Alphaproteobacteria bacterium]|nr:BON domain-containing protein [Alphaproteobacteria bacterium]
MSLLRVRVQKKCMAVMAIVFFLLGCAMVSGRETVGQYVDDTTITSKVKAGILADPALKSLQVNVETMQGVVQLSGFVDSSSSATRAVKIARRVEGVKSVKDNLLVHR